jgi:hypothetical protein
MPTDFFLRSRASGLGGAGQRALSQRRGRASSTVITTTTASGTNIQVTATAGGQALTWFSEPFTANITISGTVTVNIRGLESAAAVNAGRGILIERTNNAGTVQSSIVADTTVPSTITEFTTSDAANGSATYTPTSTAMSAGDRIKVTLKVRNVGTMGSGTATISHDGAAVNAAGDTYVRFTENIFTDEVLDVSHYQVFGSNGYKG